MATAKKTNGTGKTKTIIARVPPQKVRQIDAWRAKQRPLPTRSEAIRKLIDAGLATSRG